VLGWALFIFFSSTSVFATPQTSRIIVPLLRWLLPGADEATLVLLHEISRKCAHFVNYFVLSLLLFRALRAPQRGWAWRWAALAFFIAAAYAATDEYHQSFAAGRGASALDALLDMSGAATAQFAVWILTKSGERPAAADS
jgi:VanZ family protein